jgi:hypothetical protein
MIGNETDIIVAGITNNNATANYAVTPPHTLGGFL